MKKVLPVFLTCLLLLVSCKGQPSAQDIQNWGWLYKSGGLTGFLTLTPYSQLEKLNDNSLLHWGYDETRVLPFNFEEGTPLSKLKIGEQTQGIVTVLDLASAVVLQLQVKITRTSENKIIITSATGHSITFEKAKSKWEVTDPKP